MVFITKKWEKVSLYIASRGKVNEKNRNKIGSIVLAGAMVLSMINIPVGVNRVEAAAVPVIDSSIPKTGNITIEVPGLMKRQDIEAAIARINEIRQEACELGLPYPDENNQNHSTTKYLKEGDLDDIVWSLGMENQAIIRAAEASVLWGHTRPNSRGEQSYDMLPINGTKSIFGKSGGKYFK